MEHPKFLDARTKDKIPLKSFDGFLEKLLFVGLKNCDGYDDADCPDVIVLAMHECPNWVPIQMELFFIFV